MKRLVFLLALLFNINAIAQTPWISIPSNRWLTRTDIQTGINEGKLKVIGAPPTNLGPREFMTAYEASSWVGVSYSIPFNRYITKQTGTWTDPNAKTRVLIYLDYYEEEEYDEIHGYRYFYYVLARSERPVDTPVTVNIWVNNNYAIEVTIPANSSSSDMWYIGRQYLNTTIRWVTPTESSTQIYYTCQAC